MGQVYSQKLTAKIKQVYLDMIKNLLIMLTPARSHLTKIWYAYYLFLAQMWIMKASMSQLVWKKLWADMIGQNEKKLGRLSITCLWKMALEK